MCFVRSLITNPGDHPCACVCIQAVLQQELDRIAAEREMAESMQLCDAAQKGDTAAIERLLHDGADPNNTADSVSDTIHI